jgi:tetratricopeptide (TPR) repeat protein
MAMGPAADRPLPFIRQPEADRLVQAAAAELVRGHLAQAARLLDGALQSDPRHPMALTKQAELALCHKDHARALAYTAAALAIEPNFAPAWHERSAACWLAGRPTEAVHTARQAMDIQPPNPEFRLRFAQFAAWTGHGAEVLEALQPLLDPGQYDPTNHAQAVSMLGELAIAEGRFDAAPAHLDQALDSQPGMNRTRMLRGMNQLRRGHFRSGWVDYAAREGIAALCPDTHPSLAHAAWQGQPLEGKTLLVIDDQGHGDAIQFFRYLPLLRDRGAAHVTWRTFSPLVRLLGDAAPYATVLHKLSEGVRFDFQCNSISLPRWFATELHSVPASWAYLRPPLHSHSTMQQSPGPGSKVGRTKTRRLEVGLVWSGDARHTRDHLRSIPADLFLSLADLAGISFHSLQHQVRILDRPALEARKAIRREVEKAADFADTAALIARLDLVITVDTAIAHLAGALGKPVWIVLHVAPDWRWLADRSDSPWYPTARLFRVKPEEWLGGEGAIRMSRKPRGELASREPEPIHVGAGWEPVLARVATALLACAAG